MLEPNPALSPIYSTHRRVSNLTLHLDLGKALIPKPDLNMCIFIYIYIYVHLVSMKLEIHV